MLAALGAKARLESPFNRAHGVGMSTLAEIEQAIERLAPEQWVEIRRWMDRHMPRPAGDGPVLPARAMPDFLARQKAVFGERTVVDSQAVLDDLRADR